MLRTMKGTFSRFIAIAAIVALGVGLLSGLMAMPIDMRTTIDEYFDRQNMHDLRIVSPLGLTDDDVAAIAAVDGVDEVMPAYMTDMFVDAGEKKNIVTRIQMCIRDRLWSTSVRLVTKRTATISPAARGSSVVTAITFSPMAVRYTACPSPFSLASASRSVSYTHLDVYKRQGQKCAGVSAGARRVIPSFRPRPPFHRTAPAPPGWRRS